MSDSSSPSTSAMEVTKVLGHGGAVGTDRRIELHAVTGTQDGGLVVAVGGNGCGGEAAAWYSTDRGWTWHAAGGALGSRGNQGEVRGVAATAQGLVAVGGDRGGAAVWTSRDGAVWQRAAVGDPALVGRATRMTAVVAVDGGLVAVGAAPPSPGRGPWASPCGRLLTVSGGRGSAIGRWSSPLGCPGPSLRGARGCRGW
jgi:hypothetical protein